MTKQHRGSRSFANQLEELSPCRHLQSFRLDSMRLVSRLLKPRFRVQEICALVIQAVDPAFR
jgi:hypothetical protein